MKKEILEKWREIYNFAQMITGFDPYGFITQWIGQILRILLQGLPLFLFPDLINCCVLEGAHTFYARPPFFVLYSFPLSGG